MKKMKKILALALSGVMVATLAVLTPITSRAEGKTISFDVEWRDKETDEVFANTTFVVTLQDGSYVDEGKEYEYRPWCFTAYAGRELYEGETWYWMGVSNWITRFTDGEVRFQEGDSVLFNLPFVLDADKVKDYYYDEYFEYSDNTDSSILFVCADPIDYDPGDDKYPYMAYLELCGDFDMPTPAPQNEFWLEPMKTQLAIAAEVAAANGSGVAEVSGDFSLSYEIMKWLEDHPGVTLKYTLTYNGEEHLIVIQGGQKLANPEIPWYGPEYLIGYFGK